MTVQIVYLFPTRRSDTKDIKNRNEVAIYEGKEGGWKRVEVNATDCHTLRRHGQDCLERREKQLHR